MVPENFQTLNDVETFIFGKLGIVTNGSAESAVVDKATEPELVPA
jgi:hypothetical protein